MRKGAVPVPYIIALLLGIAVVAILGYWFFVLGGQLGGEVSQQSCTSKASIYCTTWQANGYATTEDDDPNVGGLIGVKWFSKTTETADTAYAPKCSAFNILNERSINTLTTSCKNLLGTS